MLLNKRNVTRAVLLAFGVVSFGTGIVTYYTQAAEQGTTPHRETTPGETKNSKAASIPSGEATAQPVELGTLGGAAILVRIGAVIDGVLLDKLDLTDEVKVKARQALRRWYVNELADARKQVHGQMAGADAAQRARLEEAIKDYSIPYRSAQ